MENIPKFSSDEKKQLLQAVKDAYERLNVEQKQVIEQKHLQQAYTAEQWLDYLQEIAEYDYHVDNYLRVFPKKYGDNSGCLWALSIGTIIFGIWLLMISEGDFRSWIYIAIFLSSVPFWVWHYIYEAKTQKTVTQKRNMPNFLRNFIVPLVAVLKEETRPQTPIQLNINMRDPAKTKQKDELKKDTKGNGTFYIYDMLNLRTRLSDGTVLWLKVQDVIRERFKYKRKGNKYKIKVKRVYQLQMSLPKKHYTLKTSAIKPSFRLKKEDKPTKYGFKVKLAQSFYQTTTTYKGNQGEEYWKYGMEVSERKIPNLNSILDLIATVYKQVDPIEATTQP
ncbi:MAG: hypothetical protein EAZ55_06785 [Cytophagales bacterium]|nr:MAG: hypothetical protein EAZ55_06785 [Cytophagales bacterium]